MYWSQIYQEGPTEEQRNQNNTKDGKVKAFRANPGSLDADDACKQEGTIRNWCSAQQRDINETPVGPNRTVAAYWHGANCISSAESRVYGSAWGEQQGPEPSREGETDSEHRNRAELEVLTQQGWRGCRYATAYGRFSALCPSYKQPGGQEEPAATFLEQHTVKICSLNPKM